MGVDASDGLATEAYSDYLCEDCEIFQSKDEHSHNICQIYSAKKPPRAWTKFEKIENAGTEVLQRCVRCRVCKDCKTGDKIELSKIIIIVTMVRDVKLNFPFLTDIGLFDKKQELGVFAE